MNQITKLNLESRVRDLKAEEKTEREIAYILSAEANQRITQSTVHRFLANNTKLVQQAVESSDKLKIKVAELELNTVEERRKVIDKVKGLAEKAESEGDYKTALYGLKISITALESLDERLGDISRAPQVNVGFQFNQDVAELKSLYIGALCPVCKKNVHNRLREVADADVNAN